MSDIIKDTRVFYTCLILRKDDKVLLLKRGNTGWMDGYWCIPGGGVEIDETFSEALIREIKEELGITLQEHHLELAHILELHMADSKRLGMYFIAHHWEGDVVNNEPHEHSEMAWFEIEKLPELVVPGSRHVIENLKTKKSLSIVRN